MIHHILNLASSPGIWYYFKGGGFAQRGGNLQSRDRGRGRERVHITSMSSDHLIADTKILIISEENQL